MKRYLKTRFFVTMTRNGERVTAIVQNKMRKRVTARLIDAIEKDMRSLKGQNHLVTNIQRLGR